MSSGEQDCVSFHGSSPLYLSSAIAAGPLLRRDPPPLRVLQFGVQVRPRGVPRVAAVADQFPTMYGAVRHLPVEVQQAPGVATRSRTDSISAPPELRWLATPSSGL